MSDQTERRITRRREAEDSARRREQERRARTDILCRDLSPEPRGIARAQEELRRLDQIADRNSLRGFPDFQPERELALERREIRDNPTGFVRRHEGQGLDEGARRELCRALRERSTDHPARRNS